MLRREMPRRVDALGTCTSLSRAAGLVLCMVAQAACGADDSLPAQPELPRDGVDAGGAGDIDAGADAGFDATVDVADASTTDGAPDASVDASSDTAHDAATDGGGDADSGAPAPMDEDAGTEEPVGVEAPVILAAGYFSDGSGSRLLVRGSDPDGDVATYTLAFLQNGQPVAVDLDGQGSLASTFTSALEAEPGRTDFDLTLDLTPDFAEAVDALEVTVTDAAGHASATTTAMRRPTPTRALGETCDLRGFNRCAAGICAPATATTYVCTPTAMARNTGCATARVLSPPEVTSVRGTLNPYSLWDVPAGCTPNNPKRRPDSVVTLRLAADAQKVTLSTRNAVTTFDSQLYVLLDCPSNLPACINEQCPCADDVPADPVAMTPASLQAVLTLYDLQAGDYQIVIDSLPTSEATGDDWELTVSVE